MAEALMFLMRTRRSFNGVGDDPGWMADDDDKDWAADDGDDDDDDED